jgi:hypothetical protein
MDHDGAAPDPTAQRGNVELPAGRNGLGPRRTAERDQVSKDGRVAPGLRGTTRLAAASTKRS